MSEEVLSRLKKKKFSSLSRNKARHRVGSSPIPINNLTGQEDKSPYNADKNNLREIYSPSELIKKSERIRNQLERQVPKSPTKRGNSYSFIDIDMEYVKDVSGSKVLTHSIIRANPKLEMFVSSVDKNGHTFKSDDNSSIKMYIPIAGNYIVFTRGQSIIDKLAIHETQVESIKFGDHRILVALKNLGYIYVIYRYDDLRLWDFFQTKRWLVEKKRYSNDDLIRLRNDILTTRYTPDNEISPYIEKKTEQMLDRESIPESKMIPESEKILKISPSNMYEKRRTRSNVNYLVESDGSLDDDQVLETPASFDPPLKHKFLDNKIFTINYLDFKTLYNNEWINDSIIDFFIKYEVENAIKNGAIQPESIYAFNSFFFNKMMEKTANQDEPDPYQNVKRWLNKVELMSYSYIIIPINEFAHWYCCIIRGLPELLQKAKDDKENVINLTNSTSLIDASDTGEEGMSPNLAEEEKSSDRASTPKSKKKEKSTRAEIFVFDSLSQKHTNIHLPLKKVLIDYCKDKFDVEIQRDQIRVQNAKVPKQNNFNDCGIHVIYNVRKWLSNINECERLWKSSQLRYGARLFFLAEERNKMRKELINLLLMLHEEQMKKSKSSTPQPNRDESDDEIEVIEYLPKDVKGEPDSVETEIEFNFQKDPGNNPVTTPEPTQRTLDPKVQDTIKNHKKNPKHLFVNDTLNEILAHKHINYSVVQFLNDTFSKKNTQFDEEEKKLIFELVEYTNLLHEDSEQSEVFGQIKIFEEKHQKVTSELETSRPKNQEFRIEHNIGITKSPDISESDIMYDDLTNLNLSDNSTSNEPKRESNSDVEESVSETENNKKSDSRNSLSLLDKLDKNPFKKRKVV